MEQKEAYQGKMEAQLQEWDAKIDELAAKTEHATAEAKVKYQQHIHTLQTKREAAQNRLNELKNSSGGAWEDLRTGMDKAWSEMKRAVESAVEKFK